MTLAELASDETSAIALREMLLAHVIQVMGSQEAAQPVMANPTQLSAYVPAPDIDAIDLGRPLPSGQYDILVWKHRAEVVLTYLWSPSGQKASKPVANAGALRELATYVVLAAGGTITDVPTLYMAPDWLVRQVAAGESTGPTATTPNGVAPE